MLTDPAKLKRLEDADHQVCFAHMCALVIALNGICPLPHFLRQWLQANVILLSYINEQTWASPFARQLKQLEPPLLAGIKPGREDWDAPLVTDQIAKQERGKVVRDYAVLPKCRLAAHECVLGNTILTGILSLTHDYEWTWMDCDGVMRLRW